MHIVIRDKINFNQCPRKTNWLTMPGVSLLLIFISSVLTATNIINGVTLLLLYFKTGRKYIIQLLWF